LRPRLWKEEKVTQMNGKSKNPPRKKLSLRSQLLSRNQFKLMKHLKKCKKLKNSLNKMKKKNHKMILLLKKIMR
jgi:hypothetical protein